MASQNKSRNVSVLEYGRIEDTVTSRVADGERVVEAAEISVAAGVEVEKVFEMMRHMERKYDAVANVGVGRWEIGP